MLRQLFLALALQVAASSAPAQAIRVRTVEVETGRTIAGAIVVLLDSAGRRVVQGLTDDLGRITFPAPVPGSYRLKADRIGHPGVIGPFFNSADVGPITLEMPAERFELPELAVAATSVCGRRENDETARLWGEIRKALSASEITSSSEAVPLQVRRFVRYRSLSGALQSDSTTRTFITRATPFVTPNPASITASGYIQGANGQYRFFGPDAAFLLSDEFLETHCFRVARAEEDMPGLVGLGFEPVKGRDVPEIKGTLWVDRATAELRTLAYDYVNVPRSVDAKGLGGKLEFERLPSGGWIIRDWYIRMPDRVDLRPGARRPASGQPFTIVGFVDDGGTARPMGDASALVSETVARTSQASQVLRDVRVRVMSSDGTPIEGALVAVAELDTTVRSGAGGQLRLSDVALDRLRLRIRAIGHTPLSAVITLAGNRRQVDTTLTLTVIAQRLDSIVVTERAEPVLGKMEGFERRRKEGFGRFLTMEQLHDPLRPTLDQQLRRFGRIRIVPCKGGYAAAGLGGAPAEQVATCKNPPYVDDVCFMSVYIDGALYFSNDMPGLPFDLSGMSIMNFQGLEVYRSAAEMPVEYNATGSYCGVILLWTK